jgi:hypothetical protein
VRSAARVGRFRMVRLAAELSRAASAAPVARIRKTDRSFWSLPTLDDTIAVNCLQPRVQGRKAPSILPVTAQPRAGHNRSSAPTADILRCQMADLQWMESVSTERCTHLRSTQTRLVSQPTARERFGVAILISAYVFDIEKNSTRASNIATERLRGGYRCCHECDIMMLLHSDVGYVL